jgi:hypothetical protein
MKKIPISILNAINSSFIIIEDLINEMEVVFKNENKIFFKLEMKISVEKMKKIEENIKEIKKILKNIKNELNLKEERISDRAIINSRCAKIWEILNEMRGDKFKKYGKIPEEVKEYLSPTIEKILKLLNEIVKL